MTSKSERVSLNYDACIRLQTKIFKQSFSRHLDNFISFHQYTGFGCPMRINEVTDGKLKTPLKVNGKP